MNSLQVPFFDYQVFAGSLNDLPSSKKLIINTINQYSFCIAEEDAEFKEALINSNVLLPDGVGVVAAVRLLSNQKINKIAGADLFQHLITDLNSTGGRCFFLGSSEETLGRIKENLDSTYPAVQAGFYSPPFKPTFSEEENQHTVDAVNEFNPEVLFVGMTAPKQEKWLAEHKDLINARISCAIGAVFDFYAGTVERPHKLWINIGMEWFIRLFKEPKRMWKRYIYYGPVFLRYILREKIRQEKT